MTRFILILLMLFLILNRPGSARDAGNAGLAQASARDIIPVFVASSKKTSAICAPIEEAADAVKNFAEAGTAALGSRLARLTAYWSGEGDYYTRRRMSATGVRLHTGHCAVDPSIIPYGSVVQIAGLGNYLAVDTGTAVVSRRAAREAGHNRGERNALVIDLYFDSRSDGEEFAAHGPKYAAISWLKPNGDVTVSGLSNSQLREEAPIAAHKPVASNDESVLPPKSRRTPSARVASLRPMAQKKSQVVTTTAVSKHDTSNTTASSGPSNSKGEAKLTSSAKTSGSDHNMAKTSAKTNVSEHMMLAQTDGAPPRKSQYQF